MKDIATQYKNGALVPYSPEDKAKLDEYRPNQIIRCRCTGFKKPRSVQQLRLYWAMCGQVAANSDEPGWLTKDGVDFQLRVALDFRDKTKLAVRHDGTVQFFYRSIAFANLSHIGACNYFEQAFELMAKKLGVSVDALMDAAMREGG